ncbi:MAG: hypothetical protein JSV45_13505 [Chromatiales bacterium]|nr:MAG: hypothetical protein JSV45_13505 [Chromatiales bacterium]
MFAILRLGGSLRRFPEHRIRYRLLLGRTANTNTSFVKAMDVGVVSVGIALIDRGLVRSIQQRIDREGVEDA